MQNTQLPESSAMSVHAAMESHLPALRRFAQRLTRSASDREDLIQETVVRALRSAHQFRPETRLHSWLFTIMRNAFNTEYRRRCRETVGLDETFLERAAIAAPQEWAVRRSELRSALGRIPPRSRRTLLLVAMGVSYNDTARLCGCEIGTVKSRVNRARKMLEDEIGRPVSDGGKRIKERQGAAAWAGKGASGVGCRGDRHGKGTVSQDSQADGRAVNP